MSHCHIRSLYRLFSVTLCFTNNFCSNRRELENSNRLHLEEKVLLEESVRRLEEDLKAERARNEVLQRHILAWEQDCEQAFNERDASRTRELALESECKRLSDDVQQCELDFRRCNTDLQVCQSDWRKCEQDLDKSERARLEATTDLVLARQMTASLEASSRRDEQRVKQIQASTEVNDRILTGLRHAYTEVQFLKRDRAAAVKDVKQFKGMLTDMTRHVGAAVLKQANLQKADENSVRSTMLQMQERLNASTREHDETTLLFKAAVREQEETMLMFKAAIRDARDACAVSFEHGVACSILRQVTRGWEAALARNLTDLRARR